MKISFKISSQLLVEVVRDLRRTHDYAAERVGFLACRVGALKPRGLVILAADFQPVADEDYLDDPTVGAMIGETAIRKSLQYALNHEVGMFHVHMHEHNGLPCLSRTDRRETANFVPDFFHVRPHMPHGAIVLSLDAAAGLCWHPRYASPFRITEFVFTGAPMRTVRSC